MVKLSYRMVEWWKNTVHFKITERGEGSTPKVMSLLSHRKMSFVYIMSISRDIISSPVVCLCHGFMSVVDRAP